MPVRAAKQHTDRGSIKDLVQRQSGEMSAVAEDPFLPSELRMKKLYEYAQLHKDQKLRSALGFITTDYIADKNALPLSIYRIRKTVDEIKSKSSDKINQLAFQLSGYITNELSPEAIAYLARKSAMTKIASKHRPPVFWRKS